jgi:hypothetical protein
MQLAEIPQILELLEQKQVITPEQKTDVLKELDKAKKERTKAFAGEIGIRLGFYDKPTLDKHLIEQTTLKAEAAVADIQEIGQSGKQSVPTWLKANWGNNGVNPAPEEPTIADGVSAAANVGQNIVMIVNDKPEVASSLTSEVSAVSAVSALANLARGIADGSSNRVPLATKSHEWIETAKDGLRQVIEKTGYKPTDRNGTEINLEDFISERFKEVEKGVELSLGKDRGGQGTDTAPTR